MKSLLHGQHSAQLNDFVPSLDFEIIILTSEKFQIFAFTFFTPINNYFKRLINKTSSKNSWRTSMFSWLYFQALQKKKHLPKATTNVIRSKVIIGTKLRNSGKHITILFSNWSLTVTIVGKWLRYCILYKLFYLFSVSSSSLITSKVQRWEMASTSPSWTGITWGVVQCA